MPRPCCPACAPGWNAKARPGMRGGRAHGRARGARHGDHGRAIERIAGGGFGDCVRARFPHPAGRARHPDRRHLDTVHPVGTLEKLPWRREEQMLRPRHLRHEGRQLPGAGGDAAAGAAAIATPLPITVLLTPTRRSARPRPATSSRRRPRARNTCWCRNPPRRTTAWSPGATPSRASTSNHGKPSHAGATFLGALRDPRDGAPNPRDRGMTTEDCTFSVGVVHGGNG